VSALTQLILSFKRTNYALRYRLPRKSFFHLRAQFNLLYKLKLHVYWSAFLSYMPQSSKSD